MTHQPPPGHDHRCQEFLERLSRYLDNELPAPDRDTIERHLRDCPCCEEVLDSLKQTVALCHDEGRPELPPDVRERARERMVELLQQRTVNRTRVHQRSRG
jgi:anti-sigma factor RsiW